MTGATLFGTPEVHSGIKVSGLVSFLIVLSVVVAGLTLYRRGGSRPGPPDPNPGDGWSKGPRPPDPPGPDRPQGGIPLDDAVPARVRLRGRQQLADKRRARSRRPAREPERTPAGTPTNELTCGLAKSPTSVPARDRSGRSLSR